MTKLKATYIIQALLIVAMAVMCVCSIRLKAKVDELSAQEPQTVTDTVTITDVKFDTFFISSTVIDTLALADTAFVRDTVHSLVYVPVQVPLSTHIFDTSVSFPFGTTSLNGNLDVNVHGAVTGYRTTFDTLVLDYRLDVVPTPVKRKVRILPAVGVGYGTGGWGVFGGIGIGFS